MPHHVTQRGNRHENVFFNDEDRAAYLKWLPEYAAARRVGIAAYCLMTIGEKGWRPLFLAGWRRGWAEGSKRSRAGANQKMQGLGKVQLDLKFFSSEFQSLDKNLKKYSIIFSRNVD